ncbi:MAG: hypothetical protein QOD07_1430, partial [Frankiaceae bacterium]|nr:hypothetical protein [Frankiaceae bacterium]
MLLGGVLVATVTLVIMAAGRAAQSDLITPAKQLLDNANRYAATHPGHVLSSVVAYLVIAVTIAAAAAEAPGPGSRELEIVPDGAWFLVLSRFAPTGTYAQVAVTTADGRGYVGKKLYFGSELRHDDRELVLEQPIDIIQPGQTEPARLPSSWHRL